MARRTKIVLPITEPLLKPELKDPDKVHRRLKEVRHQQKSSYDKTAKPLPQLKINDKVRMQTPKGYDQTGIIKGLTPHNRSYIVESNNKRYRRNRRHLLKISDEQPIPDQDVPDQIPEVQARPRRERYQPRYFDDYFIGDLC